jgi:hypothetical protein
MYEEYGRICELSFDVSFEKALIAVKKPIVKMRSAATPTFILLTLFRYGATR